MRRVLLLLTLLLALVVFANVIAPQLVSAETFTGTIILGFSQPYGATDTNHLGVDVALPAGSALYAPVAGVVSYVGSVPAAAPAGQKVTALTIATDARHLVTLNPCADTAVA